MHILEGEGLINDGTGLVAYRFAVAAVVSGSFSLWEAGLAFVLNVAGGIAIGLAVGWIVRQVRRRLDFPAGRDDDLPAHRVLRLHPGRAARRLGRDRGRHGRDLPRLVHAGADDARGAPDGRVGVADRHLRPQRLALHPDRAPAAGDPRRARRLLRRRPALVGAGNLACRCSCACSLGLRNGVAAQPAQRPTSATDAASDRQAGADVVVGHARRRLARGRARDPADHGCGPAVPRAQPHPLPHLRRHPRHARHPGSDACRR